MGWHNQPMRWNDLERSLSGRPTRPDQAGESQAGDGSDSPAWTRRREGYERPGDLLAPRGDDQAGTQARVPYAELHCHSNFSFLDGASHPEELVEQACRLGLDAIALTDHDGMYGVMRFARAAAELGMRTVYGAELSLGLDAPQNGVADPQGEHLLLLARNARGYAKLCGAISDAHLGGEVHLGETPGGPAPDGRHRSAGPAAQKGKPAYRLTELAERVAGDCIVLTGCRKGPVRRALSPATNPPGPATNPPGPASPHPTPRAPGSPRRPGGPAEYRVAAERLDELGRLFGSDHVAVELFDHGMPQDSAHNDVLAALAAEYGLPTVATTVAHCAGPEGTRMAAALAAIRARRSLDEMDGYLPPGGVPYLRSGAEMAERFARYPGAVGRAALLGVECAIDLTIGAPELPPFEVPTGHTEASYLRLLTYHGATERYGPRHAEPAAYRQLERELGVITELGFPGYFLIVADIVRFCREHDILCQGRGSAANSAVCYALGVTKVDPVRWGLLFERFLATERDGPPDIDIDIESDRREEVIQYVYAKHGRHRAALVANVITYRARSAVRDVAKAFGYSPGQQDAWSKQVDRWAVLDRQGQPQPARVHDTGIPEPVLDFARELGDFPRHLGIHPGGMILADRPVSELCPVEWARMAERSVLQWDKDDCAAAGLVKFDLLGLGMLSALHYAIDLIAAHEGVTIDLGRLDLDDPEVYAMLQRADAVGVFQVESRAQLATLPRLKPRTFYDLAVEVALIRPGPIQGGSVHPYIRRRNGQEPVTYEHPLLANALHKTCGIPLFQEQLMQIAVDVAGFRPGEADELRRAMGAKRSARKMQRLRGRFRAGAERNGVPGEVAERIYQKLLAFANFGFPESHALSFAHLVFASAYLKRYHPAAFCAALLRAQPMGFYSPQSLVADARRHGVTVRGVCVNASRAETTLEPSGEDQPAVRIGLATVRSLPERCAAELVAERDRGGQFAGAAELARRTGLRTDQLEALATAGALGCFEPDRRKALWLAGAAAGERSGTLPGSGLGQVAPPLPGMDEIDLAVADVQGMGLSPDSFPTQFLRERLDALGVLPAARLPEIAHGTRVLIGGAVTHRQRPATAGGVTFLNIEDETGMVNVICSPGLWARYHRTARSSPALLIRGVVEHAAHGQGVISVLADRLQHLDLRIPSASRDFR